MSGWIVQPKGYRPGWVGAVKVFDPPLPGMSPVSNLWDALSVRVCVTESSFVTVTFCPGFTVIVPEYANPLIVMPPPAAWAAEVAEGDPGAEPDELPDEPPHDASRTARVAAQTATARRPM